MHIETWFMCITLILDYFLWSDVIHSYLCVNSRIYNSNFCKIHEYSILTSVKFMKQIPEFIKISRDTSYNEIERFQISFHNLLLLYIYVPAHSCTIAHALCKPSIHKHINTFKLLMIEKIFSLFSIDSKWINL